MQNIAYTQKGFGGGMLKQGLAYDFDSKNEIQVGLTQVPLVLLPTILTTGFQS
jgi:hypothetical protein